MNRETAVWFTPEGDVVCRDCREDLLPAGVPMRLAMVRGGLVECAYCKAVCGERAS